MYNEMEKSRFFMTLKIARILKHRSKHDRKAILTAAQVAFTAGWNDCDNYRLHTGTIPTSSGVN